MINISNAMLQECWVRSTCQTHCLIYLQLQSQFSCCVPIAKLYAAFCSLEKAALGRALARVQTVAVLQWIAVAQERDIGTSLAFLIAPVLYSAFRGLALQVVFSL